MEIERVTNERGMVVLAARVLNSLQCLHSIASVTDQSTYPGLHALVEYPLRDAAVLFYSLVEINDGEATAFCNNIADTRNSVMEYTDYTSKVSIGSEQRERHYVNTHEWIKSFRDTFGGCGGIGPLGSKSTANREAANDTRTEQRTDEAREGS